MSEQEKKETLADILEVEVDEIKPEAELISFETWDSVAVLSMISLVSDETGKYMHATDFKDMKTIGDLMNLF